MLKLRRVKANVTLFLFFAVGSEILDVMLQIIVKIKTFLFSTNILLWTRQME